MYHNLPYKAIPKVMLTHLAMDSTHKLNFFPAKGGVSDYFSPYVIMSGRKLDYNKHLKYQFGSYVQANQDNDPTNTNAPRTIDAIYLRPMPNLQGGHELMDLRTGRVITRRKVTEIPITDSVIRIVKEMAEQQGIKSLKLTGRNKQPIHPADWIAGVDYNAENNNEVDDNDDEFREDERDDYAEDADMDDADAYDRIDQSEIDDLMADPGERNNDQEANPTDNAEPEEDVAQEAAKQAEQPEDPIVSDEGSEQTEATTRRSERVRTAPERLTYFGTETKPKKTVKFADTELEQLENRHNLFSQTIMSPKEEQFYDEATAAVACEIMCDIHYRSSADGVSFAQQYLLKKGLQKFGDGGYHAATKELDQLHKRNCFSPLDVSAMTPEEKRKAMEALMFLTEKQDKAIKG